MKVYVVTASKKISKNNVQSKVVGFVTAFGWEKPVVKAALKYPNIGAFSVHEDKRWQR